MKKTNTKMGRPEKEISQKEFETLCRIQCTEEEICAVLDVCTDTLNKWCKKNYDGKTFSEVYKKFALMGRSSLRRIQFAQAQDNYKMAIWLGKQWLGQSDSVEVNANEAQLDRLDDILNAVERTAQAAQSSVQAIGFSTENEDDIDIDED